MGYSLWCRKELDMTEPTHIHTLNISVFSANSLEKKIPVWSIDLTLCWIIYLTFIKGFRLFIDVWRKLFTSVFSTIVISELSV